MKKLLLIILLSYSISSKAQVEKRGHIWVIGYDSTGVQAGGGTLIDFVNDTVYHITKHLDMGPANSSICDKAGNLLFYTNNCEVNTAEHDLMPGSDVLSPGIVEDLYCPIPGGGLGIQGVISLPYKESSYYLIKYNYDILSGFASIRGISLAYSIIDMDLNDGLGEMVEKNNIILEDTFPSGYLHAIQHANGRDWWVIAPKAVSNCYHKLLLDSAGLHYVEKQCIGNVWDYRDWAGQAVFSPDGTKYIRFNAYNGLNIFDFDRCNGELSNHIQIQAPGTYDSGGVGVSPNSRYLYASATDSLFQIDLQAPDIQQSLTFIEAYDGQPFPYYGVFYLQQLAPDGKIYIGGTGSHQHLHIIHQPDSAGLACDFEQHGLPLPSFNYVSMPNLPHFNMGPTEEPCDWVLNDAKEEKAPSSVITSVFPNPASTCFTLSFNRPLPARGELILYDALGGACARFPLLPGARQASFDISSRPAGLYFYEVRSAGGRLGAGKLLVGN